MEGNEENKVEEVNKNPEVNQVTKEKKNSYFKEEINLGKEILTNLWKKPGETIREIAKDEDVTAFNTALVLIVIWMFTAAINYVLSHTSFNFYHILKDVVEPALKIIVMTISFCIINDRARDTLSKVLTSITIAYIPAILASIIALLEYTNPTALTVIIPINALLNAISLALMYNTVKELAQEKNETKAIKTFMKVQAVFYLIVFALKFLGLKLY